MQGIQCFQPEVRPESEDYNRLDSISGRGKYIWRKLQRPKHWKMARFGMSVLLGWFNIDRFEYCSS
jgi:glucan biosynthesis protein